MNCTMNCSVNWHLTYRDADVSTYSDGHGAYMSIMHDKNNCNDEEEHGEKEEQEE